MAEWSHYSLPDPEWAETLARIGGVPLSNDTDLKSRRNIFNGISRRFVEEADKATLNGVKVEEMRIPVTKPEGEISIRIYTPDSEDPRERFPVLVDLHGGGYCLGDLNTDELPCRAACQKHRFVVVNVDYRLSPEFPWPVGIDDSYDAVKWVASHADAALRVDLKKGFIVSGLSAGATFTCIVTQRARVDPDLKGQLTGQILQVPPTCPARKEGYPEKFKDKLLSYEQNKDDYILSQEIMNFFIDTYKAGPQEHLEVSPLLSESFAGLPPAYIQVSGGDPLRDEGLCYAERLKEDGVPVKLDIYPGAPHAFACFFPELKISQKWRDDFDRGVEWLLQHNSRITSGL